MIPLLFGLVAVLTTLCAMRSLVHMLQLESYQLPGYFHTFKRNALRLIWPGALLALIDLMAMGTAMSVLTRWMVRTDGMISLWAERGVLVGAAALCVLCGLLMHWFNKRKASKKPLVMTPRVKRLYGAIALVCVLLTVLVLFLLPLLILPLLLPAFAPLVLPLAALLITPVEKGINRHYLNDAKRKLASMPNLIRIGITGSYGKTSVKFMLSTLLSEKFNTYCTPSSKNTPMGVTIAIRGELSSEHEVFIAEMGARHVGDIRELCDLVNPQYGILTSVGPQHLQTFFTQENITKTKYELIEAIPADGAAVFPADGAICEALFEKTTKEKHLAGERTSGLGMRAKDVEVGPWGSRFTLETADGRRIACETKLLGEHNISNLLLCTTLAFRLGLSMEEIAQGIQKLTPVEHRLQLIEGAGGVTVIDDAFNSNPVGANAALKVLRAFAGRRIVVTPGMVELGEEEDDFNRAFGETMADCVDVAVLIGKKHTAPIAEGLRSKGFAEEKIMVFASLDESTEALKGFYKPGDTVLFENDLPDHYQE